MNFELDLEKFDKSQNFSKALQKTEISELFVFASFGNVRFSKFGNFSEISSFFELAKISQKSSEKVRKLKFGNNFEYYLNFTSNTKISKKIM